MATTPPIDDQTAFAIRQAITAAGAGKLNEAVRIGEQALANGGERVALNAMLGTLHLRSGNSEDGIRHLREANSARPFDVVIATNLANALAQAGEYDSALRVLTDDVASRDTTLGVERLRGFIAQSAEEFELAVRAYERVVAGAPSDWESWNNLGNAHRQAGDLEAALSALQRAVELSPNAPPVRLNYATTLGNAGRLDEAEHELRRMAEEFPRDTKALQELHAFLKERGREEDALLAIEQAVQREPREVNLLLALGSHRLSMLRNDAAEEAYRSAIVIEPVNGPANLGLALCFELTNRTAELAALVQEAEDRGVPPSALNFIRAFDHRRAKRFADGIAALNQVPEEIETPRRWHLMGQLREGEGHYDEAYTAYSKMNAIQREDPTLPEERAAKYREVVRNQMGVLTRDWLKDWKRATVDDGRANPVFLVGFPRSGTTLLDTMLMGHPDIEVLEEEPTLRNAAALIPELVDLPLLSHDKITGARAAYFETAASLTPLASGKLLVDKNPLSMNLLPYIHRLFPHAKIVLALRHPCDTVFSCHVTNFKLNDGMSNFLRLETAAELYDLSFGYFEKASDLLGIPVHRIAYENVVEDQERELRSLLDFLELDWNDSVLDHQTTAQGRGRIKTASYAQVGQPIYTQSAGRWTNFRKQMEPVLPLLEPWIARFGYKS